LLTPGFSRAYHQHVLGVSDTTVAKYINWSRCLVEGDPSIMDDVAANAASITAQDGLTMAQKRGRGHLPWWSRLAIAEAVGRGHDTSEVARRFRCSCRTVQIVLKSSAIAYDLFTGERRLSNTQMRPPGSWSRAKVVKSG
jgi:hypothetical protein